jgi:hypothetical protein
VSWSDVITVLLGVAAGTSYGRRLLGDMRVRKVAKDILESPTNPITDPQVAAREAFVIAHHKVWGAQADALVRQVAADKIRIAGAVERQRAATEGVIESTIVPRDGAEKWD